MKRRDFIFKAGTIALGATLLPGALSRNNTTGPVSEKPAETGTSHPHNLVIDLEEWRRSGKSLHLCEEDIIKDLANGESITLHWPASDVNEPDCQILVDNWKGFIAYDNVKIISWDVDEKDDEKRRKQHPVIHGYPVVEGKHRTDQTVPLSRSAVNQHPLWHENLGPKTDLSEFLPKPPQCERFHEIGAAPEVEDTCDIRHFMYLKESEKLAYNILNWQPDILPGHPYPLSNNRFLLHLMATESALYDKIGPHPTRASTRQKRIETKDGIDRITTREGSYAGMAQMGVNRRNNRLTGSITTTPFARGTRWAGLEVNGEAIDSREDYLGDWQAQMLATLYTQLIGYEYVDDILKRRKTDRDGNPTSISGAFMMAHLRGPQAARDYLLRGIDRKDGNGTPVSYYYNKFKGYDGLMFRPELDLTEQAALKVTPEGQALLDNVERNMAEQERLEKLPTVRSTHIDRLQQQPDTSNLRNR